MILQKKGRHLGHALLYILKVLLNNLTY